MGIHPNRDPFYTKSFFLCVSCKTYQRPERKRWFITPKSTHLLSVFPSKSADSEDGGRAEDWGVTAE